MKKNQSILTIYKVLYMSLQFQPFSSKNLLDRLLTTSKYYYLQKKYFNILTTF